MSDPQLGGIKFETR